VDEERGYRNRSLMLSHKAAEVRRACPRCLFPWPSGPCYRLV